MPLHLFSWQGAAFAAPIDDIVQVEDPVCVPCAQPEPVAPRPFTLQEVESMALEQNKALIALQYIAQKGYYKQLQARSKKYPRVDFSGSIRRLEVRSASQYTEYYSNIISLSQSIYDRGIVNNVRLSDIEAKALETDLAILRNDVLFQVRSAYYELILAEEQIEVEKEHLEILQGALELEERKMELGETTSFEVHQSRVSLMNALSSYYKTQAQLSNARYALLELLGLDPVTPIALADREIPVTSVPEIAEKIEKVTGALLLERLYNETEITRWEDIALKRRPEVQKKSLDVATARRTVQQKKDEYSPTARFFANVAGNSENRFEFSGLSSYWEAGFRLDWNLFDGLGREYRIGEAKQNYLASTVNYDKEIQSTRRKIRDAFAELEEYILSYAAASQGVAVAEEAIELAKHRRELGVITPLEYRDVAASLTKARHDFNEASFRLLRAYYTLRYISGQET